MPDENKQINANECFGITEEQADKICEEVNKCRRETDNMQSFAEKFGLGKTGEAGYRGYAFGRCVARNEEVGHTRLDGLDQLNETLRALTALKCLEELKGLNKDVSKDIKKKSATKPKAKRR